MKKVSIPVIVCAGTYDSTLCGWKMMATTRAYSNFDEKAEYLEELTLQNERKNATEEEEAQGENHQQIMEFLTAIEEEQKRVHEEIQESKEQNLIPKEFEEEETFEFLRAVQEEQLKKLRKSTKEEEKVSNCKEQEEEIEEDSEGENENQEQSFNKAVGRFFATDKSGFLIEEEYNKLYPCFSYTPHVGCINYVSSFGGRLVSGGFDENFVVYNLARKVEEYVIHKLQGSISVIQFVNNGKDLILGTSHGIIAYHRIAGGCLPIWSSKAHKAAVNDIAFHPSNRLFLSVGNDSQLKVWNMITGKEVASIRLKFSSPIIRWSPSGKNFALVQNELVQIYDSTTMENIATLAHEKKVLCVEYLSDELIATGGENKSVTIYDLANGECLQRLEIHESRIKSVASLKINVDEYIIASVSSDGGVALWRIGVRPDFAALESYEKTNARFTSVAIASISSVKQFLKLQEKKLEKSTLQMEQEDEPTQKKRVEEKEEIQVKSQVSKQEQKSKPDTKSSKPDTESNKKRKSKHDEANTNKKQKK